MQKLILTFTGQFKTPVLLSMTTNLVLKLVEILLEKKILSNNDIENLNLQAEAARIAAEKVNS